MLRYSPGINKSINKRDINYVNRGLNFEKEINISNEFYRRNKIAIIYKKPTPIKIVRAVLFKKSYKITEAYFQMPSTTDYNGIYKGRYIDFEAKETASNTSFPLSNIHQNQIEHLLNCQLLGGVCFLLIRFKKLNQVYLFSAEKLGKLLKENKRSISIKALKKDGYLVPSLYTCPINYLPILDEL